MIDVVAAFAAAAGLRRKPLLVVGESPTTYGMVLDQAARLTGLYRRRGLEAGDRVVVATSDPGAAVTLHLSLLRNGLVSVVADPAATEREAQAILDVAGPRAVFVDAPLRSTWVPSAGADVIEIRSPSAAQGTLFRRLLRGRRPAAAEPNEARSEESFPALLDALAPAEAPSRIDPESIAYILFTSGSTARPKGVAISHRALFAHLATMHRQFAYDESTRLLNVLPLHHTDGMNHGPLSAFTCGGTVHRPARFTLRNLGLILDSVYRDRISHFVAVPTMLAMIAQLDREYDDAFAGGDFRFVISSAAPLAPSLWERFEERFGTRVANVYGLTETVVGGLFCGPGDGDYRRGTVGKAVDCAARIVGDDGRVLADGACGELEMRGENLLSGYFGDEAETARAFRDGWFRTGDLASRDADGFFRILGRKKNVIITGGLNVQPEEVTEVLMAAPGVGEAATFGAPDEIFGERVVACVALADGATTDENAILAHCRRHLAPAKMPTRVHLLPLLPKGASGKIDVGRLRELIDSARRRRLDDAGGDVRSRVRALAAESFGLAPDELHPQSSPENTPGWDSFAHLQLVVALEESFGVRFTTRDVLRLGTLADAEEILGEKLA